MKLKIYPRDNSPPKTENNYYKQLKPKHKMKKLFKTLFIATLLFTITANSQITKGNWMVGGDASFNYYKNEPKENPSDGSFYNFNNDGNYDLLIRPNLGYFVIDKLAIGTIVDFGLAKSENADFEINNSRFTLGLFARYYFLKSENRYNIFFEPSISRTTYRLIGNSATYAFKAGNSIFLNSSVALETSLNYSVTSSITNTGKRLFFGLGIQIHLEKE